MSAVGALAGLLIAVLLIVRRFSPVYSLMLGALVGGLSGGFGLTDTVAHMVAGVKDVVPAIIRILSAGVLSGILIKCGAAESISAAITDKLGRRHALLALALSTMMITAVGVFVDVAVITVAPVALLLGQRLGIPRLKLLFILVAGGKCGNIISPNPNTIIAAENLDAPLSSVMFVNLVPALAGLAVSVYIISRLLPGRSTGETDNGDGAATDSDLPGFWSSITAPVITMVLLSLRPVAGINIDPLVALPAGGLAGVIAMRKWKMAGESLSYGLEKMSVVAVLLAGTGTIAGIIKASTLQEVILAGIGSAGLGDILIAPVAGVLMSGATASTTAGATIASSSFSDAILASGVGGVWGAAMINSGASVLDHLPHGSFFHATGGAVDLAIKERLRLIPYESLTGLTLAACTVGCYYIATFIF